MKNFISISFSAEKQEDGSYANVESLDSGINTQYHESTVAFTPDDKVMYFTRNNYFNKKYKKDDLLAYVQNAISKNPEQSVVIAADKKVQYQEVVIVMDLLKQNEINKVGLLLKPEK